MQTFVTPSQEGSTLNLALICQAVSEEKMIELCGQGQQQRRQTPEHGYTISSPKLFFIFSFLGWSNTGLMHVLLLVKIIYTRQKKKRNSFR